VVGEVRVGLISQSNTQIDFAPKSGGYFGKHEHSSVRYGKAGALFRK
jgi:hypothetical protein